MANTTPLVTTVTKPTINPAEANSAPRVNIQEFCKEHYEDILSIIMEKVRHDRPKDVHTRLDFEKGPRERVREDSYSNASDRASEPERVLLLRHGTSDSGPDMSFDTLASPGYVSGLGRASLAKIEPTVTLLKVFQTLCKQSHWLSFAKRCALSPVCIDDNRSSMAVIETNLRGPLGLGKWTSIFAIVWFSLAPSDVSPSDSGPDMSFDKSASLGYMSVLGRASLAKVFGRISPSMVLEETIHHHVLLV
nr:hypothetical protein [Tanacetum cinerariifolium]